MKRLTGSKRTLKAGPGTSKLTKQWGLLAADDFVPWDKFGLNFNNGTEVGVGSQLKFWIEHQLFLAWRK